MERNAKRVYQPPQILQEMRYTCCPNDKKLVTLRGRVLLEEDEEGLEDSVAESRPNPHVVNDPLDIINKDER